MAKHGRKYTEAFEKVDRDHKYTPLEAVTMAKEFSFANFDETVELHARLGVDPRHAEQIVRDLITCPMALEKRSKSWYLPRVKTPRLPGKLVLIT